MVIDLNRLFQSEDELIDYLDGQEEHQGDLGMYCQWRPDVNGCNLQPLGEAVRSVGINDWWWFLDTGRCRVWLSHPTEEEINLPWPDVKEI